MIPPEKRTARRPGRAAGGKGVKATRVYHRVFGDPREVAALEAEFGADAVARLASDPVAAKRGRDYPWRTLLALRRQAASLCR